MATLTSQALYFYKNFVDLSTILLDYFSLKTLESIAFNIFSHIHVLT